MVVLTIPIRTPLTDVATHVIQAPSVRTLLPHGMSLAAAIVMTPTIEITPGVAPVEFRLRPRTAGIFPLRFRREMIVLSFDPTQLLAKRNCLIPTYILNRKVRSFIDYPPSLAATALA